MEPDQSVFDPKRPFSVSFFQWVWLSILFSALFTLCGTVSEVRGRGAETFLQDNDRDVSHSRSRTGELTGRIRNQGILGKRGYAEAEVSVVMGP